jgi:4'-phosphopantetheinyl transferase EntD
MIAQILPAGVVAVEARADLADVVLFPEEAIALGNAVEKRRAEFTTARACAHEALRGLGLPPLAVPGGPSGEPHWPAGVVGSITHCHGYRACAVARARQVLALGIDAEPNDPLPAGVLAEIAVEEELSHVDELAHVGEPAGLSCAVQWDRLLFSAKESVYKAWFPLVGHRLGFADAVLSIDPLRRDFVARLVAPGPEVAGGQLNMFSGRWLVAEGLVLTAVVLAPF